MKRVKICPNCGHQNNEYAKLCANTEAGCDALLTAIQAKPLDLSEQESETDTPGHPPVHPDSSSPGVSPDPSSGGSPASQQEPVRPTSASDMVSLQFLRANRVFTLRDGQILGRDDGSGSVDTSRINIPADAGVDVCYVSRWHCRFERRDGHWHVVPLDPTHFMSDLRQANPTFLNGQLLTIGEAFSLQHDDRLTLSDVELHVLIFVPSL